MLLRKDVCFFCWDLCLILISPQWASSGSRRNSQKKTVCLFAQELDYLISIFKGVKTNTVTVLPGMACVWSTEPWDMVHKGLELIPTLTGSSETCHLSALKRFKLPSPNFQHCTLESSKTQQGISAPIFFITIPWYGTWHIWGRCSSEKLQKYHPHRPVSLFLSYPIATTPRDSRWFLFMNTSCLEMLFCMGWQPLKLECPLGTRSGWDVSPATTKEALSQFLVPWISSALEITQTS